ncbi:hypothetical protein HMN09_01063500 [Mycena chlorophos]|uniref:Uncharacterized protein n=1 Tax=Mycena chlorophos TaxID=658473 RepID=A0A8H6VWG9_MYCCL|nr:hypothetical protein HMN09_01063500 [Mycena chlorophos]
MLPISEFFSIVSTVLFSSESTNFEDTVAAKTTLNKARTRLYFQSGRKILPVDIHSDSEDHVDGELRPTTQLCGHQTPFQPPRFGSAIGRRAPGPSPLRESFVVPEPRRAFVVDDAFSSNTKLFTSDKTKEPATSKRKGRKLRAIPCLETITDADEPEGIVAAHSDARLLPLAPLSKLAERTYQKSRVRRSTQAVPRLATIPDADEPGLETIGEEAESALVEHLVPTKLAEPARIMPATDAAVTVSCTKSILECNRTPKAVNPEPLGRASALRRVKGKENAPSAGGSAKSNEPIRAPKAIGTLKRASAVRRVNGKENTSPAGGSAKSNKPVQVELARIVPPSESNASAAVPCSKLIFEGKGALKAAEALKRERMICWWL